MNYQELKDIVPAIKSTTSTVNIDDTHTLEVKSYLPIDQKIELINWVVENSLDTQTGCFSPIRTDVFFAMALAKWYADVEFDDDVVISDAYDILESNSVFDAICTAIPEHELNYINDALEDTLKDIARYNNSFAGMMSGMDAESAGLNDAITKILEQVKNRENLEMIDELKNVVETA